MPARSRQTPRLRPPFPPSPLLSPPLGPALPSLCPSSPPLSLLLPAWILKSWPRRGRAGYFLRRRCGSRCSPVPSARSRPLARSPAFARPPGAPAPRAPAAIFPAARSPRNPGLEELPPTARRPCPKRRRKSGVRAGGRGLGGPCRAPSGSGSFPGGFGPRAREPAATGRDAGVQAGWRRLLGPGAARLGSVPLRARVAGPVAGWSGGFGGGRDAGPGTGRGVGPIVTRGAGANLGRGPGVAEPAGAGVRAGLSRLLLFLKGPGGLLGGSFQGTPGRSDSRRGWRDSGEGARGPRRARVCGGLTGARGAGRIWGARPLKHLEAAAPGNAEPGSPARSRPGPGPGGRRGRRGEAEPGRPACPAWRARPPEGARAWMGPLGPARRAPRAVGSGDMVRRAVCIFSLLTSF